MHSATAIAYKLAENVPDRDGSGPRASYPPPQQMLSTLQSVLGNSSVMLMIDRSLTSAAEAPCCDDCAAGAPCSVQRSAIDGAPLPAHALATAQIATSSAGEPLDPAMEAGMGARFGHDFAGVRVHRDGAADASAREMHARAFTIGSDIVFAHGAYAPWSNEGRAVLAHELAHVVQQRDHPARLTSDAFMGRPSDAFEREAERAAATVMAGGQAHVAPAAAAPAGIPRIRLVEEPAAGCGVCQGPQNAGNAAHALIQTDFELTYPGGLDLAELPFSGPSGNGRLDLVIAVPGGLRIGEIKPANSQGYVDGMNDMIFYLTAVGAAFPNQTVLPLTSPLASPVMIFPNPGVRGDCPPQMLFVNPPLNGVYGYYCQPPFSELVRNPECRCRDRQPRTEPVRVPVPAPAADRRTTFDKVAEFVRRMIEDGVQEVENAAREFLRQNPDAVDWLIGGSILLIVGMILQDIVTLGAGIADNPAVVAIVAAMMLVAQEFQGLQPALGR